MPMTHASWGIPVALVRDRADVLLKKAEAGELPDELARQAEIRFNARTGRGELTSWRNSLPSLPGRRLRKPGWSTSRCSSSTGCHSARSGSTWCCAVSTRRRGGNSYVLVELKQWTNAEPRDDGLVTIPQYGQPVLHPVEQVRRYCEYLSTSRPSSPTGHAGVHGIAYLHNTTAEGWKLRNYRSTSTAGSTPAMSARR